MCQIKWNISFVKTFLPQNFVKMWPWHKTVIPEKTGNSEEKAGQWQIFYHFSKRVFWYQFHSNSGQKSADRHPFRNFVLKYVWQSDEILQLLYSTWSSNHQRGHFGSKWQVFESWATVFWWKKKTRFGDWLSRTFDFSWADWYSN